MMLLANIIQSAEQYLSGWRRYSTTLVRMIRAAGLVVSVFFIGTFGYWTLSGGEYDLLRCAYMTVITLTTVGYTEVIPVTAHPLMEVFTIVLIVMGMGTVLYFVSSMTAFIVDGELRDLIQQRQMEQQIANLENHFIVAGIGNTGEYVLNEMLESKRDCIVVDADKDRLEQVQETTDFEFPYIHGDATDDAILIDAGVKRANGLICSLGNDRDNLFVTISARSLNKQLRIVTRGSHPASEQKFKMAGATSVIYTNVLGGLRMAAEAIRPQVTTFLDLMMQDHGHYRRVEELDIPSDSPLIGQTLREIPIRKHTDALIIAVYDCVEDEYTFNPGPTYQLTKESKLIVLTLIEDIGTIEEIIHGEFDG